MTMRLILGQTRIRIVNIHTIIHARARIRNRLDPAIEERKPRRIVIPIVHPVVELHLEGSVAVRVRRGVGLDAGHGGALAAVRVEEEVPRSGEAARVGVPVVAEGGDGGRGEELWHEGLGEEVLVGVVGCDLLEGPVGEGGQGVEPRVCADGSAGDAHLLEERRDELVVVCAGAVVDAAEGGEAREEEAHVEFGRLGVDGEVLQRGERGGELGCGRRLEVVVEDDVALRGGEGLEFEVGDDPKGRACPTESPE